MKIDSNISKLPVVKSNPNSLFNIFGNENVSPMWVADMEYEIANPIQLALLQRIVGSSFGYEYKPESYYLAQQSWYKRRYNIELEKDTVLYCPTITTSIAVIIEKFSSVNDGVIIQPPVFMEFQNVIRQVNRKVVKNPLKLFNNRYEIDFDDLTTKAKQENNKVLILCNPHNPVGRVWSKAELERICTICKENNILLISDEVHKDIILYDNKFTSALHFADKLDNMVVCTSEAKTFNLCSISDAMVIIPNENIRKIISKIFKKYNFGSTNALTRVALQTAYLDGEPWLNEVIKTVENNILSIEKEITNSKIKLIKPEGTYQVWLDFRDIFTDTKQMFSQITNNSKIAMNAGHWFGREGALFMRMNIATSNHKVVDAIKKVIKSVEEC